MSPVYRFEIGKGGPVMTQDMREISIAAVDIWGLEAQMLMVAEEAVEVAHAIMKWRRGKSVV